MGWFDELSEDMVEEILARLPLQSSVAASAVCKRWKALVSSSAFSRHVAVQHHLSHRPWFFLAGLNHFLAAKNQAFGYDPLTGTWQRFRAFALPPYDQASLTGTHGLLFALAGSGICKLGFTPCLMKNSSWRETPPLLFSRRSPIVAMVRSPDSSSFRLVVAGGKALLDRLVVEIYDSARDAWQLCAPLPPQFRFSNSSQWMCSAVFRGKFIAYETHTGYMACLDLERLLWSSAALVKPPHMSYSFLIACRDFLVLAGLCHSGPSFKLWTVDVDTLSCTEMCNMPDELFALFDEEDEEKDPLISCVGGGDCIYVYSDSWHKDYLTCLCDLSGGKVRWRKLPALPAPVNRFDKVVCFSSAIMPDACV